MGSQALCGASLHRSDVLLMRPFNGSEWEFSISLLRCSAICSAYSQPLTCMWDPAEGSASKTAN